MNWLRHVLSAPYLYAQESSPIGYYQSATLGWGLTLCACLLLAWFWRKARTRRSRATWLVTSACWASFYGWGALAVRPWVSGALSARVWFFAPTVFALFSLLLQALTHLVHNTSGRTVISALALLVHRDSPSLPWRAWTILCAIHSVALGIALNSLELTTPLPLLFSLGLCFLLGSATSRWPRLRRTLRIELLSPLLVSYIGWCLIQWVSSGLGVELGRYRTFPYAEPWSPWLDIQLVMGVGVFWTLLAIWAYAMPSTMSVTARRRSLAVTGLVAAATWYAGVVVTQSSRGVTGSDPFCYLQMAEDLARHGTPLHAFPLAELSMRAGVPTWPIAPVGYHPPGPENLSATVWPVGWPLLMAPFYLIGGESLAMFAAPVCAILAAVVTLAWARRLVAPKGDGWLIGGIAAILLITSQEGALRTLVPMADAAAQLSTICFMLCLWRAFHRQRLGDSALAGLALAMAYWIRHPQLLMGMAFLVWVLLASWDRRAKMRHLFVFGAGLAVGMLPDLIYHTRIFGMPWITESPEWHLISWRNIPLVLQSIWRDGLLRRSEFGYLWPIVGYGLWRQIHQHETRVLGLASLSGFIAVFLFSLCYSALRWRDLVPLLPWIALWAGWGICALWRRVATAAGPPARRAAFIGLVLLLLGARCRKTADLLWRSGVWTFGHVNQQERLAYAQLANDLPGDAAVACGLNSGAIARYVGCETFRPSSWSVEELGHFCQELAREGYTLFVLDDSQEMTLWLETEPMGAMQRLGQYAIPTFGLGGQRIDRGAILYTLGARSP